MAIMPFPVKESVLADVQITALIVVLFTTLAFFLLIASFKHGKKKRNAAITIALVIDAVIFGYCLLFLPIILLRH